MSNRLEMYQDEWNDINRHISKEEFKIRKVGIRNYKTINMRKIIILLTFYFNIFKMKNKFYFQAKCVTWVSGQK